MLSFIDYEEGKGTEIERNLFWHYNHCSDCNSMEYCSEYQRLENLARQFGHEAKEAIQGCT